MDKAHSMVTPVMKRLRSKRILVYCKQKNDKCIDCANGIWRPDDYEKQDYLTYNNRVFVLEGLQNWPNIDECRPTALQCQQDRDDVTIDGNPVGKAPSRVTVNDVRRSKRCPELGGFFRLLIYF